jgi:tetratricopeptide (TPR) repeat protein
VEAAKQLTHALRQISTLPTSPRSRSVEIKFQVAFANALIHTKGYAAPEKKMAFDQARILIARAEALGEPPEDPLLLFSVLYGVWAANLVAFKGDALRELSAQFLALAEKQTSNVPIMVGHRLVATSLMFTGELVEGRAHYDQALALYDPNEHRSLTTRFGQDVGVVILSFRSWTLWLLGYPEAAGADIEAALKNARDSGHAATLMYALFNATRINIYFGNHSRANEFGAELVVLADEKRSPNWKALATINKGLALAVNGNELDAIKMFTSGMAAYQSIGSTLFGSQHLSYLASAYAEVSQFEEAWRCISESMTAIETTKESGTTPRSIGSRAKSP